jgi:hypothetical protein
VAETIGAVLSANGQTGRWLLTSLPDYVVVAAEPRLDHTRLAAWFGSAHERACSSGLAVWDEPVANAERLRRLASDPETTVERELERARLDINHSGTSAPGDVPAPLSDYSVWFDVASEPNHAERLRAMVAESTRLR